MQNVILKQNFTFLAIFSQAALFFNILNISFFILIIFSLFLAIVTMIARQINSKSLKKLDFWMVKKFSKPTEDFRGASSQVLQRLLRESSRCPPPRARQERKKLIIVIIAGAIKKWSSTGSCTKVISQIWLQPRLFTSSRTPGSLRITGRLFSEEFSNDVILWCLSFLILCRSRLDQNSGLAFVNLNRILR